MIRELDLFTGVPSKDCFLGNVAKLAARLCASVHIERGVSVRRAILFRCWETQRFASRLSWRVSGFNSIHRMTADLDESAVF
jgi:hypothetical protein